MEKGENSGDPAVRKGALLPAWVKSQRLPFFWLAGDPQLLCGCQEIRASF